MYNILKNIGSKKNLIIFTIRRDMLDEYNRNKISGRGFIHKKYKNFVLSLQVYLIYIIIVLFFL